MNLELEIGEVAVPIDVLKDEPQCFLDHQNVGPDSKGKAGDVAQFVLVTNFSEVGADELGEMMKHAGCRIERQVNGQTDCSVLVDHVLGDDLNCCGVILCDLLWPTHVDDVRTPLRDQSLNDKSKCLFDVIKI